MKPRMNFYQAAPETIKALVALEAQIQASGLEKSLIELVKTRASQINGCAYCIHMHTADARKQGETEQRLYLLNAWRELPLYTDRERAALAWTEAVTLIAETHAPDDLYEDVARPVLGIGDGKPDHADRRHQRVEPDRDRLPRDPSGEGAGCGLDRRRPREVDIDLAQALGHRAGLAVADGLAVDRHHRLDEHVALVVKASLAANASSIVNARSSTRSWRSAASATTALRVQPGKISLPFCRVTMTSSWVRMKAEDEPPSVTFPSSIIQASPAPAAAAACLASTCASSATLLMSRRVQRRSGTVITATPVWLTARR